VAPSPEKGTPMIRQASSNQGKYISKAQMYLLPYTKFQQLKQHKTAFTLADAACFNVFPPQPQIL
jgi:hypothetical protein